jgi:hypothetical protein
MIMKTKIATCKSRVPSILSPTKQEIGVGEKMEFLKIYFHNGEHWLKLKDGKTVPSVFFNLEV